MPKLHAKLKVLNGRAAVISYEREPDVFYYRELISGTTSYRTKKLKAKTLDAAQPEAVDAYSALRLSAAAEPERAQPPPRTTTSAKGIQKVIQEYLKALQRQVQAKQISQGTLDVAESVIYKLVYPFFKHTGITKTSDIQIDTFHKYVV